MRGTKNMNSEKYIEYQKCGNLIDFYHHIMKECNQIIKYNQFLKSLYSILETFTNEKRANVFRYYYIYNHSIVWIRYNLDFRSCTAVERIIHTAEKEISKKFVIMMGIRNTYNEIKE